MDPIDVLKRAASIVDEAEVPSDLRGVAFAKVLDLLVGQNNQGLDNAVLPSLMQTERAGLDRVGGRIHDIASQLGVPADLVDRIFDEIDGAIIFCGDVAGLGRSKVEKVQSLAILLLAGRRWSHLDGGGATADEILRAEIDRLGLLDVSNYSKQIASLKSLVTIIGSGRRAQYKIKYDGLEKAKELGRNLAGF